MFQIGPAGIGIGAQAANLKQQFCTENFGTRRNGGAFLRIMGIEKSGGLTGRSLDYNLMAGLRQRRNEIRRQRNPAFARIRFFKNADFHVLLLAG